MRQVIGSIPTREIEIFNIFISSLWQSVALSSITQQVVPPEFDDKWRAKVSYWERSIITLGSQVPSAYAV